MNCRSDDKVLCPWCGAEMVECVERNISGGWVAWLICKNGDCLAEGPMLNGKHKEKTRKAARTAALRRYTPPLKPMTLEEALGKSVVLELRGVNVVRNIQVPVHLGQRIEIIAVNSPIEGCYSEWINRDDYNRTWRCWERQPTDEERSAAEWSKP